MVTALMQVNARTSQQNVITLLSENSIRGLALPPWRRTFASERGSQISTASQGYETGHGALNKGASLTAVNSVKRKGASGNLLDVLLFVGVGDDDVGAAGL